MKKKIIITILIFFTFFIIHQGYWYSRYGGNFIVWIDNFSEKIIIADVEVFLDGKKIFNKDVAFFNKPNIFSIYPGAHKIKIICKPLGINNEYVFNSFLVQRGIFSFYFNSEKNKIEINFHNENVISAMISQ